MSGSRPKELFLDVLEELEAAYEVHRDILVKVTDALGDAAPYVGQEAPAFSEFQTLFSAALDNLGDEQMCIAAKAVPPSALQLFFKELRGRAIKAARKAQEALLALLLRADGLGPESTFEQAHETCSSAPEWDAVPGGEEARREVFGKFLQRVAKSDDVPHGAEHGGSDSGEQSDGRRHSKKDKRHRKSRKRHHRDSDSSEGEDEERRHRRHKHKRDRKERRRSRSPGRYDGRARSDGELEEGEVPL